MSHRCSRNFWDRREFLFQSGGGISGLALAWLLDREGVLAAAPGSDVCSGAVSGVNPYAPKATHFAPRAKHVIQIELPPLIISGSVCPVTGNNSTATAILIMA